MDLITDGLLAAAAVFAGAYCFVLARRVRALTDLDKGLGGAITTLNRQLAQAEAALSAAKAASAESREDLRELIAGAEAASGQLRMLLAATRGPEDRAGGRAAVPAAARDKPAASRAAAIRPVRLSDVASTEAKPAEVPKPRAAAGAEPPVLRPRQALSAGSSETDLIAALEAIAAGAGR